MSHRRVDFSQYPTDQSSALTKETCAEVLREAAEYAGVPAEELPVVTKTRAATLLETNRARPDSFRAYAFRQMSSPNKRLQQHLPAWSRMTDEERLQEYSERGPAAEKEGGGRSR